MIKIDVNKNDFKIWILGLRITKFRWHQQGQMRRQRLFSLQKSLQCQKKTLKFIYYSALSAELRIALLYLHSVGNFLGIILLLFFSKKYIILFVAKKELLFYKRFATYSYEYFFYFIVQKSVFLESQKFGKSNIIVSNF